MRQARDSTLRRCAAISGHSCTANGLPFTWERFVDSYVQLATFGVLLWRLETGQSISLGDQVGIQSNMHPLLTQCLSIL